mmetsp:Transcript_5956/g.20527  ORF Transcript_5956/g.20527 Transcript_5956/m.20527 type:complete len:221 (-) Transcript_5956:373-1035(-)
MRKDRFSGGGGWRGGNPLGLPLGQLLDQRDEACGHLLEELFEGHVVVLLVLVLGQALGQVCPEAGLLVENDPDGGEGGELPLLGVILLPVHRPRAQHRGQDHRGHVLKGAGRALEQQADHGGHQLGLQPQPAAELGFEVHRLADLHHAADPGLPRLVSPRHELERGGFVRVEVHVLAGPVPEPVKFWEPAKVLPGVAAPQDLRVGLQAPPRLLRGAEGPD